MTDWTTVHTKRTPGRIRRPSVEHEQGRGVTSIELLMDLLEQAVDIRRMRFPAWFHLRKEPETRHGLADSRIPIASNEMRTRQIQAQILSLSATVSSRPMAAMMESISVMSGEPTPIARSIRPAAMCSITSSAARERRSANPRGSGSNGRESSASTLAVMSALVRTLLLVAAPNIAAPDAAARCTALGSFPRTVAVTTTHCCASASGVSEIALTLVSESPRRNTVEDEPRIERDILDGAADAHNSSIFEARRAPVDDAKPHLVSINGSAMTQAHVTRVHVRHPRIGALLRRAASAGVYWDALSGPATSVRCDLGDVKWKTLGCDL